MNIYNDEGNSFNLVTALLRTTFGVSDRRVHSRARKRNFTQPRSKGARHRRAWIPTSRLKARDRRSSGSIEVDDLRDVLSKFGFRLTRFRFNSVVKLLFELEGATVAYAHVVRLVLMAQNKNLFETMSVCQQQQPHPMLRPSVMMYDDLGQSSMRSLSNYNLLSSTRQVPVMAPPSMDEPSPSDFVSVAMGSAVFPQIPHRNMPAHNVPRPSVSSHALHDMFNLQRLSDSLCLFQGHGMTRLMLLRSTARAEKYTYRIDNVNHDEIVLDCITSGFGDLLHSVVVEVHCYPSVGESFIVRVSLGGSANERCLPSICTYQPDNTNIS
ncbi:hypothetical protein PHYPSEUDO_007298 [Phytophthora pseudosyringae]|uniref:Uncharacterized protein n=1 Tax=Phytophthora pseudosyringae TaxID=221518 RepID=A0A8T1VHA3_9STRA|nr:hypothetical protein PHYPSEUDO_007298 [Phytophthora pseudosyringae]